jgi:pyroglutamyl-peptidase
VVVQRVPCVFGAAITTLRAAIDAAAPLLVIGVGQAEGRIEMSIERVAINLDDGRIPDNAGRQPVDVAIEADGPAAYFATLPIKAITRALRAGGIPAAVSQTAGTFVCNHVFYGLMHYLATRPGGAHGTRGGFIHVPMLPEQAARHPGRPSMALATLGAGLRIAIETALALEQDIAETGGALN